LLFGTEQYVAADVILVHVDLSVVPEPYLEFAARYPIALNGRVKDIRKSTFSQNLVGPHDSWDGPVIVKSDLNCAGRPERVMKEPPWARKHAHARRALELLQKLTRCMSPFEDSRDYVLYRHVQEVPRRDFHNRHLVIEKFLPEIEDGLYHVRTYQFLGHRWTCTRLASPEPIVKVSTTASTEEVEPHEEIIAWRRRLSLDYGKLDYVVHGGRGVLFDVNKTTGCIPRSDRVDPNRLRQHRAAGIELFF
jgi:hypothetical protein